MRGRRQWVVLVSVLGIGVSVVMLVFAVGSRARLLVDTGETRDSVVSALARLLPSTALSAKDPALTGPVQALSREKYVAFVWLTDASG